MEHELEPGQIDVVKAQLFGPADEEHSGSLQIPRTPTEAITLFAGAGALDHPFGDQNEIAFLLDHSTALRQCIDSYATNIDGFGHRLEPIIDLEADDADDRIANALWMRKAHDANDDEVPMPTPAEVKAEKKVLALAMRREKLRIESFIEYVCLDHSFIRLRRRSRQERELLGNSYWELERDAGGRPVELHYMQSSTMRLTKLGDSVSVEAKVKISDIDYSTVKTKRRFRTFVQVVGSDRVYFKEFGDPRALSRLHGVFYNDVKELQKADTKGDDGPASEIVHFKVDSPSSPYGMPRWAGAKILVFGLRESEEVNRDYFEKKAVPPLAIAVSGGSFDKESVKKLEDHFENHLKGKSNFHRVLFLEAQSAQAPTDGGPSRTRIQFFPLTDAMLKDSIFGNYDVRCVDKIGFMFRLPRLLRGDIQDFNRSTSEAALVFAEMQVFQPERQEFDDWMNRHLFADLGFRYWKFVSNGPIPRDSTAMADLIVKMSTSGVITAEEARKFAADVFNERLQKKVGDWLDKPFPLSLKTAVAEGSVEPPPAPAKPAEKPPAPPSGKEPVKPEAGAAPEPPPPVKKNDLEDEARHLIAVRAELLKAEEEAAEQAFAETVSGR